ncbi:hypothetical protein BS50DRAFT_633295 [Corynespora cassiicola Philippines]|uniref:Mid2 domain-containing protein n=1 Tax=Corynespora cassiicola Philippines TaxID=1448308 RepID=A0A2T2NQ55_CORCC|nr:hypothetical protein BS50DRAFT_633295 [Corynespora cassiicola Philippines]
MGSPIRRAGLVLLLLLSMSAMVCADTQCYNPDGSLSTYISCNPDPRAFSTLCCPQDSYCTKANLCLPRDWLNASSGLTNRDFYLRGRCSDRSGEALECGRDICNDEKAGGERVRYCGDGMFCCAGRGQECCNVDAGRNLRLGDPIMYATVTTNSSTLPLPSASHNSTTAHPPLPQTTPHYATPSPSSSSPRSSERVSSDSADSAHSTDNVAVGAGVGASVGFVFLAGVGVAGWYIRRRYFKCRADEAEGRQYAVPALGVSYVRAGLQEAGIVDARRGDEKRAGAIR